MGIGSHASTLAAPAFAPGSEPPLEKAPPSPVGLGIHPRIALARH